MIKNWVGFYTLSSREIMRFFSVWRQTIIPGIVTTLLYIFVFGVALENRISEIGGVSYKIYILPGLLMMNVITNAVANSASSMLQMKLLQTLPELLITPLSSLELSLSFIIGGAIRGFVNGKVGPKDGEDYVGGNFVSTINISSTLPHILSNLQTVDFSICSVFYFYQSPFGGFSTKATSFDFLSPVFANNLVVIAKKTSKTS